MAGDYLKFFSPETIQTLKGRQGQSLRTMLGNKNLRQVMMESQELLDEIAEAEDGYQSILSDVAISMVKDAYPIIDYAGINIDAKIGGTLEVTKAREDKPEDEEEEDEMQFDHPEVPEINMPESVKRRIINGITQGSSIRGAFAYLLFREYLDDLDPTLVEKYNKILNLTFGIYDDDNAVAMMLAMLAQNQKISGGESECSAEEDEETGEVKLTIKATALNFPFLVHEIVKGLYEIISLQGFSGDSESNAKLVQQTDTIETEPHDFQIGKFIYDDITKLWQDSGYDDSRIRELLFVEIYKLDDEEFLSFIQNALNNKLTPKQTKWASDQMRDINADLKKDDLPFGVED